MSKSVQSRVLSVLFAVAMLLAVSVFAVGAQAASGSELATREQVLQLVNMERSKAGLPTVDLGSEALNAAAAARAQELTTNYSYVRPNGQREFTILADYGVSDVSVGEAYWAGCNTPEEAVEAWMNNAYFSARILDKNVKNIGVGHYVGGAYGSYWVVIFTYPANTNENAFAQQVLALVNKERTTRGLNSLVLGDAKLNAATAQRAREIAEVNSHTRPDGSSCFTVLGQYNVTDEAVGENAAWGEVSPEEVVTSWMNSTGHRDILLDPNARKMSVACYYNANSTYGTNWDMLVTK